MGEAAKKICLASLKNQSCHVKLIALKPFSFIFLTKLFICVGSSFQVGEGSFSSPSTDAKGRNNPELDLTLGISTTHSAQTSDNHNHTSDQVEKNLIKGSPTTPGAGVNFNINQVYERQLSIPGLELKLATEKEDIKKLNRYILKLFSLKHV